jgi:hypothetical protein
MPAQPAWEHSEAVSIPETVAEELGAVVQLETCLADVKRDCAVPPPSSALLSLCYWTCSHGSPASSGLFSVTSASYTSVISQHDLVYYVFLPLLADAHAPHCTGPALCPVHPLLAPAHGSATVPGCLAPTPAPPLLVPAVLECLRALARHRIPADAALARLAVFALVATQRRGLFLHCMVLTALPDSDFAADCLVAMALEADQPLLRQQALDCLYRRGDGARVLRLLLHRGEAAAALRLVSHRSALFNQPSTLLASHCINPYLHLSPTHPRFLPTGLRPSDFLAVAIKGSPAGFAAALRYFEQRNIELHGHAGFAPGDQCDVYVHEFEHKYVSSEE